MTWMGECLLPGTVLGSSLACTEASKVDRRSWVVLHQGGGRFHRRVRFCASVFFTRSLGRGSIVLEDVSEMLKFGCCGGGVTDLVSSVLHTP